MSAPRSVLQLVDPTTGWTVEVRRTGPLQRRRWQGRFPGLPAGRCYTCEVRGPISRSVYPVSRAAVRRLLAIPQLVVRRLAPSPRSV